MTPWLKYGRILIGRDSEGGEMARLAKILPDVEELKKMFYLDSSIPEGLRWKIRSARRVSINDHAGCLHKRGYFNTRINGNPYQNHRIIYSITNNINLTSDQIIDHIDRDPQNNHPHNLRIVTAIENQRNRTKASNKTSIYVGVYFNKNEKTYCSQICVNKKQKHLGSFQSEKDAALAYNNYIISHNLTHFNLNDLT